MVNTGPTLDQSIEHLHSLNGSGSSILNDHLVDLGIACEEKIRMLSSRRVNVSMSTVASTASLSKMLSVSNPWARQWRTQNVVTHVPVDPFQPMLSTMSRGKIL